MRPHRLEIDAFGAFPGRVELDFDRLGAGGLVLLCGETGGGKTTILDALGFALYGTVPGLRARAKDLRSHHADPHAKPGARLDFSMSGRRYRIARTVGWNRPKRSGEGTVRVNPTALLERWTGTGWEVLATRNDDVGLEIGRILGMTPEQFFQVIMLPQGRFADFLQADHDTRERLLKNLFHVDRFEHAEQWLADQAKIAAERLAGARSELARVAARAAEVAEVPEPDDPQADADWVAGLAAAAEVEARDAADGCTAATETRRRAEVALEEARDFSRRRAERRDLDARLATLEAQLPLIEEMAAEMAAARRAGPVRRALEHVRERADDLARACQEEEAARERLRQLGARHDVPVDELARLSGVARTDLGRLEQLADVLAGAEVDDAAAAAADADADAHVTAAAALTEFLRTELPMRRSALEARRSAAQAASITVTGVREQARLAGELARASRGRVEATARARDAEQVADEARRRASDIRRQRFDAITAELAAALVDDTPCPVCGSLAHPDLAEVRAEHVSKDDEVAAEAEATRLVAAATGARSDADRLDERIRTLIGELASRAASAAGSPPVGEFGPPDGTVTPAMAAPLDHAENSGQLPRPVEEFATVTVLGIETPTLTLTPSRGEAGAGNAGADDAPHGRDGERTGHGGDDRDAGTATEVTDHTGQPAAVDPARLADLAVSRDLPAELPAETFERIAADLANQVGVLTDTAADLAPAEQALARLDEEQTRVTAELAGHASSGKLARAHAQESRERAMRARSHLPPELRDARQLAARRREVAQFAETYAQCHTAAAAAALAQEEHRRAASAAEGDARTAGFPNAATAEAHYREDSWIAGVEARLAAHRDDLVGVRSQLASPQLNVDPDAPVPVADREADALRAREGHESALAEAARTGDRARRLSELVPAFAEAVASVVPLRDAADEVRGLAELAAGRGGNRHGMPLSSFVLAARLEEVASAASGRLSAMTGGRFTLVHDAGERRDRRRRAGLGLLVEDAWTGRRRDTATLSGGETFQAALSLALGLADVVTAEAGGQAMDALFIDEGFGSLDPDSLEEVMNVLDELRSGGRLVGVVSHVSDLRQRIPTQVRVVKTAHGSHVRTTTG